MRRIWKCLLGIGPILPLTGCRNEAVHDPPISSGDLPVSIVIATDLHDLSPSLTDGGELFRQIIRPGDGKTMEYIQEIMTTPGHGTGRLLADPGGGTEEHPCSNIAGAA